MCCQHLITKIHNKTTSTITTFDPSQRLSFRSYSIISMLGRVTSKQTYWQLNARIHNLMSKYGILGLPVIIADNSSFGGHIAVSGCLSLSKSLPNIVVELSMAVNIHTYIHKGDLQSANKKKQKVTKRRNPTFAIGISILFVTVSLRKYFWFCQLFPDVGG